jgi:hypothetical protein
MEELGGDEGLGGIGTPYAIVVGAIWPSIDASVAGVGGRLGQVRSGRDESGVAGFRAFGNAIGDDMVIVTIDGGVRFVGVVVDVLELAVVVQGLSLGSDDLLDVLLRLVRGTQVADRCLHCD